MGATLMYIFKFQANNTDKKLQETGNKLLIKGSSPPNSANLDEILILTTANKKRRTNKETSHMKISF